MHQKAAPNARRRFRVDLEKKIIVDLTGKSGSHAQMKVTLKK